MVPGVRPIGSRLEVVPLMQLGWIHTDQPLRPPQYLEQRLSLLSAVLLQLKRAGLKQWVHSMSCNYCSVVMLRVTGVVQGCPFCDVLVTAVCCRHKLTGVLQLCAPSKQHTTRSELMCPKHSSCPMSNPSTEQDFLRIKFRHRKIF